MLHYFNYFPKGLNLKPQFSTSGYFWVAAKELTVSYYNDKETLLFTICLFSMVTRNAYPKS